MRGYEQSRRNGRAALRLCAGMVGLLVLSACGGNGSPAPTLVAQAQASPALSPGFDSAIHDYTIDCTSASEVQFSASLNALVYFNFTDPNDTAEAPSNPIGQFQKTFTLNPGQRFRFSVRSGPEYSVRCLPKDFPPLSVSITGVREAAFYLFAPTIYFTAALPAPLAYVIITDANGTPIWWKSDPTGIALDAKLLGSNEIAWTTLTFAPVAQYFIRNFSGEVINVIGSNLNDHELQPTPNGTFLAIRDVARICPPDCADMSPWGGSAQTAALDQEVLELDQNSNVLWTWRTRDHIALSETGAAGWFPGVGTDIIHMNAVQPDGTDAVLFSARHLNAVYRIIKSTGAIDWKIGGTTRPESLAVIGDTRPTAIGANGQPLSGQHDVRLWSDGTISVHDNGTNANRQPAIIRYQVDTAARTAQVVEEVQDARATTSKCCGSARRLPGGHWLAQWGGLPYMTELDASGNPTLTINYNLGAGFSYRAVPIAPGAISADAMRVGMDAMAGN